MDTQPHPNRPQEPAELDPTPRRAGSAAHHITENWAEPGAGPLPLPGTVRPDGSVVQEADVGQAQIDRVVIAGQGHSVEELDRIAELEALPPIPAEELARQAEAAPGADGDPSTPE